jgi:hypothetical protein
MFLLILGADSDWILRNFVHLPRNIPDLILGKIR